MDFVLKDEVMELMRKRSDNCVSVFLPTHRAGREIEQDPIRLDNLLRRAEKELVSRGVRSPEAKEMLAPAYGLVKNGFFARHLGDGLSLFTARGYFRYFRVPIHFDEHLAISDRFSIKPLVPMLNTGKRFLILAASRKSVRLFEATEFGINEIELTGVPQGIRETLGYDDTEARLLFRAVAQAADGRGVATFHGHGGGIEADKDNLRQYFQRLKDSLQPYLKNESAPLVFAGVDYLFPIFRLVDLYRNTLGEPMEGNPDGLDPRELLERGLPIAAAYFRREIGKAVDRYRDLLGSRLCSDRIEQILPAAFEGRIETLFVDTGALRWGRFDPATGSAIIHSKREDGDEDLLETALSQTSLNRGSVYALNPAEMPGATEAAAVFRY